ncbi:MAG: aminotransferase class III-fold pyridoxal phosphate-dependent enzyme [Gammaproteobacteria bacterium]|nr:aminotransferase class III-fold pyridoxal phosphate-dependent enzyme [Gammaproteobacteria bacterium]
MTATWPFAAFASMPPVRIERARGAYLYDAAGHEILDAAGGAIAVNIGHGRAEVADAMHAAAMECSYAVPPWLTPQRERLITRLLGDWLPPGLTRIHLTASGSEGVETAIKIALEYHAARGQPDRTKIIAQTPSYHGTTLAALAVSGHESRRFGLDHALPRVPHVPAPYALRCPAAEVGEYCLDALADMIHRQGADTVAGFLAEPIVGASGGALVPPDGYWQAVRRLCDDHDILLLADEVMCGFGRTGTRFALDRWAAEPDILVAGKGLAGGYAPVTGVFGTEALAMTLQQAGMNVMFHTFAAHPAACAAADKVLEILSRERLVERAAKTGATLKTRLLDAFAEHPHVAEVRGAGLLIAVEVVLDRDSLARYEARDGITTRITSSAHRRGVSFYPGGTGSERDIVMIGPPFTIGEREVERIVDTLVAAVDEVTLG